MNKSLLLFVFIFLNFFSIFGQDLTKLTDYHSFDFSLGDEVVFERDSHYYRIIPNNSNRIEVWEFLGNTVNKIYESKAFMCKDEFFAWKRYKDYLIFYAEEKFRLENIFTDKISEEIFVDKDTLDEGHPTEYSLNKGVLRIRDYKTFELNYDIDHKEFVPPVKEYITFRTADYYYFWRSGELTRRPYNNEEVEIISSNLTLDLHQTLDNRFYCQENDRTLLMVDEADLIHRQYYFDTYIEQVFPIDSNKLIAYGYNPSTIGSNYFFTFDRSNLEFGDTLANDLDFGNLNFGFQYYYDNKILFTSMGISCFEVVLNIYDFKKKKLCERECLGVDGYALSHKGDSIVFIRQNSRFYNDIFALNMKDITSKRIDLTPYEKSGFERNPYVLHYKNSSYLRVINKSKGKTYAKYNFNQNKLHSTNAYVYNENGIGKEMKFNDNLVYLPGSSGIKILDKSKIENLNIHNFSKSLKSNLVFNKGIFYYVQLHDFRAKIFDLIKYDPKTNLETKLIEEFRTGNVQKVKIRIKENFLVIEINDFPIDMEKDYGDWKIYDLENRKMLNADAQQVELIDNIFFKDNNYYYSYIGLHNNRQYQKILISNLNQKEETQSIKVFAKIIIDEDSYSYVLNNEIFYCEKGDCKKLNSHIHSDKKPKYFISPDQRFFGLTTDNFDKKNQIYIYDRDKKSLKKIDLQDYSLSGKTQVRFVDKKYIYLKQQLNNDNPTFFLCNLFSAEIHRIPSAIRILDYYAINEDEIHFLSKNKILIYDRDLKPVETISFEDFNINEIKKASPFSDSTRVIFVKPHNRRAGINNSLYTYNPSKRGINKYFECDDSLTIEDIAITNTSAFCLLKSKNSGFQIYEMNLERHYTNTFDNQITVNNLKPVYIYPNPVSGKLFFDKEIDDFKIFSISGKLMMNSSSKTKTIEVSSLPQGIYIVEFGFARIPRRLKFIKTR